MSSEEQKYNVQQEKIPKSIITKKFLGIDCLAVQGPISRKPRKHSGPVKLFSVHLYLKLEKCIPLKLLV